MDWIQVGSWAGLTAALMTLAGLVGYSLGERKGENTMSRLWENVNIYKANLLRSKNR